MLILSIISFVLAKKVKIYSAVSPSYMLSIIRNGKGGSVRMLREADIPNVFDQSVFDIEGKETKIQNSDDFVCGKYFGSGVVTCKRWISKNTVFKMIEQGDNVKFQTDGDKCLTMTEYDANTKGYYLNLQYCKNLPMQEFKVVDVPNEEEETKLAPFPDKVPSDPGFNADITKDSSQGGNFRKSPEYNSYVPSLLKVTLYKDCISKGRQPCVFMNGNPSSYVSINKFRRDASPLTPFNNYTQTQLLSNVRY